MSWLLEVRGVSKRFGGVQALDAVDLSISAGGITGLIGPNGSGKSTLFHVVSGVQRPDGGEVSFDGGRISGLAPHEISRRGLARTFQLTRLFGQMTVRENLAAVARGPAAHERAGELLRLVGLDPLGDEYAANLSYGQGKLLEFARALVNDPRLVLLDEPFAGVNPVMEQRLIAHVHELVGRGVTFLVTDHEMRIILALCGELYVLDHGVVIARGAPEEVRRNQAVIEAYFGR
jgi:ABC-type branched-subunit amino acid transport system ATPase component